MEGSLESTNGRKLSIASKNKAWMKRTLKNTIKLVEILQTEEVLTVEMYNAFRHDYGNDFKEFGFSDKDKEALESIASLLTFHTIASASGSYFTQLLTKLKNLNINHGKKKS